MLIGTTAAKTDVANRPRVAANRPEGPVNQLAHGPSHLGGVRMISADSGTLTVDRRSAVSPLAGGETTVKLNSPLALPVEVEQRSSWAGRRAGRG